MRTSNTIEKEWRDFEHSPTYIVNIQPFLARVKWAIRFSAAILCAYRLGFSTSHLCKTEEGGIFLF